MDKLDRNSVTNKSVIARFEGEELKRLRKNLEPIFRRYRIQKAILFGSLARGNATRRSDVDLILIQQTDKRFLDRYEGILLELGNAAGDRTIFSWMQPGIFLHLLKTMKANERICDKVRGLFIVDICF